MYQNFDEKYVTINYDEGSSATLTQTTLAYWDEDYGKKVLTNDEQLNMYMKPVIKPAIKYLMYDNMEKLVDANAFINATKEEDALGNIKYNFYTKRNVRYTILFPNQFENINITYLNNFESLYQKFLELSKLNNNTNVGLSTSLETEGKIVPGVDGVVQSVTNESSNIEMIEVPVESHEENELEENVKIEKKVTEAFDDGIEFKEKLDHNKKPSRVIFNEDKEDEGDKKQTIKSKEGLDGILASLDLD